MTVDVTELLANIIISLLGMAGLWVLGRVSEWLKTRTEATQATQLDQLIYDIVAAAEQTLKASDPTGMIRKQYVVDLLQQLGFEVNKELLARVEAAVYAVNLDNKVEVNNG